MVENPSSLHILIVDDEQEILDLYKNFLSYTTHKAQYCRDGQEALLCYRTSQTPIDVIITDNRMPLLSGIELVKQIRETDPLVPIAMATCALQGMLPSVEKEVLQLVDLLEEKEDIILNIGDVVARLYYLGQTKTN